MKKTVIFDTTEAVNPERRGIGVQMRSWLEAAPFADYPHLQFIFASRTAEGQEPLQVTAPNARQISQETATEAAFIDYLYGLGGDLLFFPLASQKYIRDNPAKVIGVDYGMEDLYCRNYIEPRPIADMMRWHEFAMKNFAGIVTVSKTSQRDLAWFFPEYADRIEVIYPGSVSTDAADEQGMPAALQDTPYFLIIGYEHKKNILRITQAYDAFKQQTGSRTKLAIAGNPGYGGAEIDNHIKSLTSAKDIVRLGYVPMRQKQLLMQHCRALVALPIYEGFGISALEGLQAGRVVLVSDNGSLKEIVGNAGYTANPFSVASMEEQFAVVDALKSNPKKQYIPDRLAVFDQAVQTRKLLDYLSKQVLSH